MGITVDAATLARGWLSVAQAAATKDREDRPALWRTVCVEQHTHGLRLTSLDNYMLLTAWVAEQHYEYDAEPGLDEVPYATAVAIDGHGRGAGLLAYVLALTKPEDGPKNLDVVVSLNVPWQAAETPDDELQLEGFEALALTMEYPDNERVQLQVYEGTYPNWRPLLARRKTVKTSSIGLSQWIAGRLAKAAKPHDETTVIRHWFGGQNKPIGVAFGGEPEVSGLVMPVRWDIERDEPWADPTADATSTGGDL
ncbi:MAG: hypothetical protein M3Y91_06730 [Actinomycetota bacterium]|nr:hypothetical protein [Actinomycetota bacterium]